MSYFTREASVADGSPFFLYEFNTAGTTYRYTDHPEDIQWNGETWEGFPVKHSDVKQTAQMSKNNIKVTIPIHGELAGLFLGWAPDHIVTLTLRRGHFGESEVMVEWKGRVSSHRLMEQALELSCESIFTSMRRSGARARFQRNCRHALYGKGCGVDKAAFAVEGTVDAVSGLVLTIPEAASQTSGWFVGGAIEFPDGSFRMITVHSGTSITLSRASRYIVDKFPATGYGLSYGERYGGISVTLYPGCDRTMNTCRTKFNNLDNNGGFRWIPNKNPMGGSSIV